MILIAEPVHFGDTHVQVNTAFVALFRAVFTAKSIDVVAEEKHIEAIRKIGAEKVDAVNFIGFKQYSKAGSFFWFQKIWGEWRQIFKVVLKAKKENPELLVWLCLFPTGHLFQKLLCKLLLPKQQQLIVFHGELEYLNSKKNQRWSERFLAFFLKNAIKKSPKNIQYLVLGPSIKDNLPTQSFPDLQKVSVLQHPFLYDLEVKQKELSNTLNVCVFGALTKEKNVHLIYELAARFELEIKEGIVQFQTFGVVQPALAAYRNSLVQSYKPDTFLPHQELEEQLSQQHLALFFYDQGMYQLCASGALHEALKLQLPFISIQNDYFKQVNDAWKPGILVSNLDEMEAALREILNNRIQTYSKLQSSIIMFLQQNSFLLQSEKLGAVLKRASLLQSE